MYTTEKDEIIAYECVALNYHVVEAGLLTEYNYLTLGFWSGAIIHDSWRDTTPWLFVRSSDGWARVDCGSWLIREIGFSNFYVMDPGQFEMAYKPKEID